MRLSVSNRASAVLDWWDSARDLSLTDRVQSWVDSLERNNADVYASYFPRFGRREDLASALALLERDIENVRSSVAWLLASLDPVACRVAKLLGVPSHEDAMVVVMVGVYGSSAWTVEAGDVPISFFAVERLPKRGGTREALVAHELAHRAHQFVRPELWPRGVGPKLVEETVAIATSMILVPGLSEAGYTSFDERDAAWIEQCRRHHEQIVQMAFRGDLSDEADRHDRLFGRHPSTTDLPARCGYYLAQVLAAGLAEERGIDQLVRLPASAAEERLARLVP